MLHVRSNDESLTIPDHTLAPSKVPTTAKKCATPVRTPSPLKASTAGKVSANKRGGPKVLTPGSWHHKTLEELAASVFYDPDLTANHEIEVSHGVFGSGITGLSHFVCHGRGQNI